MIIIHNKWENEDQSGSTINEFVIHDDTLHGQANIETLPKFQNALENVKNSSSYELRIRPPRSGNLTIGDLSGIKRLYSILTSVLQVCPKQITHLNLGFLDLLFLGSNNVATPPINAVEFFDTLPKHITHLSIGSLFFKQLFESRLSIEGEDDLLVYQRAFSKISALNCIKIYKISRGRVGKKMDLASFNEYNIHELIKSNLMVPIYVAPRVDMSFLLSYSPLKLSEDTTLIVSTPGSSKLSEDTPDSVPVAFSYAVSEILSSQCPELLTSLAEPLFEQTKIYITPHDEELLKKEAIVMLRYILIRALKNNNEAPMLYVSLVKNLNLNIEYMLDSLSLEEISLVITQLRSNEVQTQLNDIKDGQQIANRLIYNLLNHGCSHHRFMASMNNNATTRVAILDSLKWLEERASTNPDLKDDTSHIQPKIITFFYSNRGVSTDQAETFSIGNRKLSFD